MQKQTKPKPLGASMAKLVLVVAIIVSLGAVLGVAGWMVKNKPVKISQPRVSSIRETVSGVEMDKLVSKIINNVIPENYIRESAKYFINDLNNDGLLEIVIGFIKSGGLPIESYLIVVNPVNEEGNYKKIADFTFERGEGIGSRDAPHTTSLNDVLDIDGDGKKEMILDLGTGGASNEAYGIFKIDWSLNKINWLRVQRKDKTIENTYFSRGGSVMHQEIFEIKDIDLDGVMELIEKEGGYIGTSGEPKDWEKEENWKWQTSVYKWDGSIFDYNAELSSLLAETADWKTYKNEEYGFKVKYPEDWKISESLNSFETWKVFNNNEYDCIFTILPSEKNHFYLLEENQDYEKGNVYIDNTPAIKFFYPDFPEQTRYSFTKMKGEKAFYFRIFSDVYVHGTHDPIRVEEHNCGTIFSQMLSNFRFLTAEEITADWQTYKNKEYGFEIKYPEDWKVAKNILSFEPNLVFCPISLATDPDPEVICKIKQGGAGSPKPVYEDGMIYLFAYDSDPKPNNPKYHYLGPASGKYYYLYSEGNESIANQILSTFKFIEK